MENYNHEDEICKRKKAYEAGIDRNSKECDVARNDPDYLKSREQWKLFKSGRITAEQLKINLTEDASSEEILARSI